MIGRSCSRKGISLCFLFTSETLPSKVRLTSTFSGSFIKFQRLPVRIPKLNFRSQFQCYSKSTVKLNEVHDRAEIERRLASKISSKLTNWDPRTSTNGEPTKIYEGMLNSQIKSVKFFSFTTTTLGLLMQPLIYQKMGDESLGLLIAACGMVGFFTYITPFLIHLVAKRYVTELIYDPKDDTYTAATYSFFLRRNELKFKIEDIIVPEVPGLFTTIVVQKEGEGKKYPLFLADISFKEPKHFGRFMGYDKPIDFKLNPDTLNMAIESKKKAKLQS